MEPEVVCSHHEKLVMLTSRKPCYGPEIADLDFHETKDSDPELQQEQLTFTLPFTLYVLFITPGARDQHHHHNSILILQMRGKHSEVKHLAQDLLAGAGPDLASSFDAKTLACSFYFILLHTTLTAAFLETTSIIMVPLKCCK